MNRCIVIIGVIALYFSGCASTNSAIIPSAKTNKYDSACVIGLKDASSEMGTAIKNSLLRRGIKTYDTNPSKECHADFVVKYIDTWHWDIVMYLKALDIQFVDSKTSVLLANGNYVTWGFHQYRSPEIVSDELLKSIFNKINSN